MEIPFTIGHREGRSKNKASGRVINMFLEVSPNTGEKEMFLCACPGLKFWADTGTGREIRGIWRSKPDSEYLYVVSHDKLYQYQQDKTKTELGTLKTLSGRITMADNGQELMIVDGDNGRNIIQLE